MTNDFNSRLSFLSYDDILLIYNENKVIDLNNVLEGFESDFFAISTDEKKSVEDYTLTYIGSFNEIKGISLRSGRNIKDRDFSTLRFAKIIESEFPEKNAISVFNLFQRKLKQYYESLGILCIPESIAKMEGHKSFLLSKPKKSVEYLMIINPLKLYKSFFERDTKTPDRVGVSKLYLMLEGENGFIKIGQTKNKLETRRKGVAEPTLKAKEPKIFILCAWIAPKEIEKTLHLKFELKRKRGEWFDLRANDLDEINNTMLAFEMIKI